jgi:hypothetical protein
MAREQPLPPVTTHRRFTRYALRINREPESHFKRRAELTGAANPVFGPGPNFTRKAELLASVDIMVIASDELGMGQNR